MSFETYIKEMKRRGWTEEELKDDYALHENLEKGGYELPWFPADKKEKKDKGKTV